jgi:hypothetical protein
MVHLELMQSALHSTLVLQTLPGAAARAEPARNARVMNDLMMIESGEEVRCV